MRVFAGSRNASFSRWMSAVVAPVLVTTGCATIGTMPPQVVSEHTVSTVVEPSQKTPSATSEIHQDGTTFVLDATGTCLEDDREIRTIERVTEAKHFNQSSGLDWLIGGLGAACVGVGATMVATPGTFVSQGSPATATQPATQPTSPGAVTGGGVALAVLGAAILAIPVVDAVRASRSEKTVVRERVEGPVLKQGVECPSAPLANAQVVGRVPGGPQDAAHELHLGNTDARGHAHVDLDTAIDPAWVVPRDLPLQISVGWQSVRNPPASSPPKVPAEPTWAAAGNASLEALYKIREDRAWAKAEPVRCQAPKEPGDCDPLVRFVAAYGTGPHGAEAKATVDASHATVRQLAEAAAWKLVDVPACARLSDPDALDFACQPVRTFVTDFPDGRHLGEAKSAIAAGEARAKNIRQQVVARQRAAEAADRQKEAADEAKAKAALQNHCQNACLFECSHHLNEGSCLAGCIPLCVSRGQ